MREGVGSKLGILRSVRDAQDGAQIPSPNLASNVLFYALLKYNGIYKYTELKELQQWISFTEI